MQALLAQTRDAGVRAYFVWGPFLKSDSEEAARSASQRYIAPNSVHFWTPTDKLSRALAAILKMAADRLAWDVYLLYSKGTFWDTDPPVPWYWQHQLQIVQGESFDAQSLRSRIMEALRLPPR